MTVLIKQQKSIWYRNLLNCHTDFNIEHNFINFEL